MSVASICLMLSLAITPQAQGKKADWQTATSAEGGFSVSMPGPTEAKKMTQDLPAGLVELNLLIARADGVVYVAMRTESDKPVPMNDLDNFFVGVRDSYIKGKTLQKEERGTFQKMPILYLRATSVAPDGQPKVEQTRFIVADADHTYNLIAIVPKGVDVNSDINKFFTSFKRVEGKAVAKSKTQQPAKAGPSFTGPAMASNWKTFTPAGKGVSVLMPAEPKYSKQDTPDGSVKVDAYMVEFNDRVYTAMLFEFPAALAKQDPGMTLDNLCKGAVDEVKGKVIDLKPVKDEGLEGREMNFEFPGPNAKPLYCRARAFLVGSKAYLIGYYGDKGTTDTPEIDKFLESFKLMKNATPAKAKAKTKGRP